MPKVLIPLVLRVDNQQFELPWWVLEPGHVRSPVRTTEIKRRRARFLPGVLPDPEPHPPKLKAIVIPIPKKVEEPKKVEKVKVKTVTPRVRRQPTRYSFGPVWSQAVIDGLVRDYPKVKAHAKHLGLIKEEDLPFEVMCSLVREHLLSLRQPVSPQLSVAESSC